MWVRESMWRGGQHRLERVQGMVQVEEDKQRFTKSVMGKEGFSRIAMWIRGSAYRCAA